VADEDCGGDAFQLKKGDMVAGHSPLFTREIDFRIALNHLAARIDHHRRVVSMAIDFIHASEHRANFLIAAGLP
jgi:hypothetical protein